MRAELLIIMILKCNVRTFKKKTVDKLLMIINKSKMGLARVRSRRTQTREPIKNELDNKGEIVFFK